MFVLRGGFILSDVEVDVAAKSFLNSCEKVSKMEGFLVKRIPLSFAVAYHGLLAGRTGLSQNESLNLLLLGDSDTPEKYLNLGVQYLDSSKTSKYANGHENVPRSIRDVFLSLPEEEIVRRIQQLDLNRTETTIKHFFAFLEQSVDLDEEKKQKLTVLINEKKYYEFVAQTFCFSMNFRGNQKNWVSNDLVFMLDSLTDRPLFVLDSSDDVCSEDNYEGKTGTNYYHVPSVSPWFSGRVYELEQINSRFSNDEKIVVITGPGGFGKTQLARKYALDYSAGYSDVFWINEARETSQILDQYADFLYENNAGGQRLSKNGIIAQFKKMLSEKKNWLIVFDNANCADNEAFNELRDLIPSDLDNGRILITARNYRNLPYFHEFRLYTMEDEEEAAIEFLLKRSMDDDSDSAELLADRLGYHPLAMEIAAAYIATTPGFTILKYLVMLDKNANILKHTPEITDYNKSLHEVIHSTLASLMEDNTEDPVVVHAEAFLLLCAFFAPNNIMPEAFEFVSVNDPYENTECYLSEEELKRFREIICRQEKMVKCCEDELNRNDLVALLSRYGLFVLNENGRIEMHELVQEIIREEIGTVRVQWAFALYCYDKFSEYIRSESITFFDWNEMLLNISNAVNILADVTRKADINKLFMADSDYYELRSHLFNVLHYLYTLKCCETDGTDVKVTIEIYNDMMDAFSLMYEDFMNREIRDPLVVVLDMLYDLLLAIHQIMIQCVFFNRYHDALCLTSVVINCFEKLSGKVTDYTIQKYFFSSKYAKENMLGQYIYSNDKHSIMEYINASVYMIMAGYMKFGCDYDQNLVELLKSFFELVARYSPVDKEHVDVQVMEARKKMFKAFCANKKNMIPKLYWDSIKYPSEHDKE